MTITRTNFPQYQVMTGSSARLPKWGPLLRPEIPKIPWSDFAKLGPFRPLLLGRTLWWLTPYLVSWRLRWLYVRLGNHLAPKILRQNLSVHY